MEYFINQLMKNDCGFASLKILLANVFKNEEYLCIKQRNTDEPYSLKEIIQIAKNYNVILKGYKVKNKKDISYEKCRNILLVLKEKDRYHMVYVKKVSKGINKIYDPDKGIYFISFKNLCEKWTGEMLILDNHGESALSKKSIFKPKSLQILTILNIFNSIFLILGFIFMTSENYFYVPLIFFSLYFIFNILFKSLLSNSFKNSSDTLNNLLFSSTNRVEIYSDFCRAKGSLISSKFELITSILTFIFFFALLSLNETLNIVILLTLFLYMIFDYYFFNAKIRNILKDINFYENQLNDIEYNPSTIIKIDELTHKFYKVTNIRKILITFICFLSSFIIMGMTQKVSLNFIVFYYFIYSLICEKIDFIFNYSNMHLDNLKLRAKIVTNLYNKAIK